MKERVLIVGGGGREHALGWKLQQSSGVTELHFAPGNAGTEEIGTNAAVDPEKPDEVIRYVVRNTIDRVIVGPEGPLAQGLVDKFVAQLPPRLKIFGPTQRAARLESSKAYAATFMKFGHIPHPETHIFDDSEIAHRFIKKNGGEEFVIKADGLAGGKGVILPVSSDEAHETIDRMMVENEFGDAGKKILIQKRLEGEEISIMAIADGETFILLPAAQDYKRLKDNDTGPNTGGMGAFASKSHISDEKFLEIKRRILRPTIDRMKRLGHPYKGILYAGLMMTKEGPQVLEYNVRFGDPETQPVMMLLESDLLSLVRDAMNGRLERSLVETRDGYAVCVVLAAESYPQDPKKGEVIHGLDKVKQIPGIEVFHAGTMMKDGKIVTNGGRVLGVTAHGKTLKEAADKAYSVIGENGINFERMQYRTDIGAHKS